MVDLLILWGAKDNMMPEAQRHRLRNLIMMTSTARVQTRQVAKAGHFAAWDNPDLVAAMTLDYLIERYDPKAFGDFFFGFGETKIWKGDEKQVLEDLRSVSLNSTDVSDLSTSQVILTPGPVATPSLVLSTGTTSIPPAAITPSVIPSPSPAANLVSPNIGTFTSPTLEISTTFPTSSVQLGSASASTGTPSSLTLPTLSLNGN